MSKEFIQVTCTKTNGDFILCSNLSIMDNQKMSPGEAFKSLQAIAIKAQIEGYAVEWTVEELSAQELEFYGDLFEMTA